MTPLLLPAGLLRGGQRMRLGGPRKDSTGGCRRHANGGGGRLDEDAGRITRPHAPNGLQGQRERGGGRGGGISQVEALSAHTPPSSDYSAISAGTWLEIEREQENVTYVSYWKQRVTGSRFPARFRRPHNKQADLT